MTTYAILGAGQAGGRAAETLREEGFDGRIVLVGAEPERPYERPPLSKGYLLGTTPLERIYLQPAPFYRERDIELVLDTAATRLMPEGRVVELSDGQRLAYDKLLIATGVRPRTLPVPGADLPGVCTLRTIRDAEVLSAAFGRSPRVVIVGAGFIGAEVAAAFRTRGVQVTMVEALDVPLKTALGERIGGMYAAIHRDEGVDLRVSSTAAAFRGAGRVEDVVLDSGEVLPCDLALIGIGCTPNVELLADSGLTVDNGVVVDEYSRSSYPDIYAAGDVACWWHPTLGEYLRVEHWDNAENQGMSAARSMLGILEPYAPVPYFWSDQYDYAIQYLGHHHPGDEEVVRGSLERRTFTLFYLRDRVPVAALILNRPRDGTPVRRLIAARQPVDPLALADEGVELRTLVVRKP